MPTEFDEIPIFWNVVTGRQSHLKLVLRSIQNYLSMKSKTFTSNKSARDSRFLLLIVMCGVGVLPNPILTQKSYATSSIAVVALLFEDVHVYGKVTTEGGDPLPGVNIQVDSSSKGSTTDAAGKFDLQLPEGRYVLRMSFVGYE